MNLSGHITRKNLYHVNSFGTDLYCYRLKRDGVKLAHIANLLGVSITMVNHRIKRAEKRIEQYNKLLEKQDGKCAICLSVEKLVVDHCHEKGIVRGLLCNGCNVGLGAFRDSPHILKRAAEFIKATM